MHPRPQERVATLDLLRLVSALAVVAFHYLFRGSVAPDGPQQAYPEAAAWAMYGWLGLNLFFLISGYVIAWSAEGRDWTSFALARFARLWPGYVACMTITAIFIALAGMAPFQTSLLQWLANLTMVAPAFGQPFMDGVYWTIVLELIFYFWVAASLAAGLFERRRLELVAFWLLIAAVNEHVADNGALRMLLITEYASFFAFGLLVQHAGVRGLSPLVVLLMTASFAMSFDTLSGMREWMLAAYGVAPDTASLAAANVALHAVFLTAVGLRRMLPATPFVMMLGGLTYPLYLIHQNAGVIALNHLAPDIGRWPALAVVIVAALAVSWLVWRFVETPGRRAIMRLLGPVAERVRMLVPGRRSPSFRATPAE